MPKAQRAADVKHFQDIPNIGSAMAADFKRLKIATPQDLVGRDPYALYDELCRLTRTRHDPCVIDAFIAAVRFMEGAKPRPWWAYTTERKRTLRARATPDQTPGSARPTAVRARRTSRGTSPA